MPDSLFSQRLLNFQCRAAEAHHFLANPFLNNFIETDECAAANEQNFLGIDLNVFLMWMFASALWRNIARAALQNLQQSLLHSFAGHIASNAHVVSFPANLIDLVDVNDPDLRSFHIVIRILQESQNNVFNVFANVAGFGTRILEDCRRASSLSSLSRMLLQTFIQLSQM